MSDLVERLRGTPNWQREDFKRWKDGTCVYDRAPFEAADRIEALEAEVAVLRDAVGRWRTMYESRYSDKDTKSPPSDEAEVAALRKDAERWRFDCACHERSEFGVPYWEREGLCKEHQDAAMDAAIQQHAAKDAPP